MQSNKTCQSCGTRGHSKYYCKTRKKKPIKQLGKQAKEWMITRNEWFKANAAPDGYYYCHYCGLPMVMEETTLDHIKPKGSHIGLKHNHDNLVTCCLPCNQLKGSRSYESFCAEYFPHLLVK